MTVPVYFKSWSSPLPLLVEKSPLYIHRVGMGPFCPDPALSAQKGASSLVGPWSLMLCIPLASLSSFLPPLHASPSSPPTQCPLPTLQFMPLPLGPRVQCSPPLHWRTLLHRAPRRRVTTVPW